MAPLYDKPYGRNVGMSSSSSYNKYSPNYNNSMRKTSGYGASSSSTYSGNLKKSGYGTGTKFPDQLSAKRRGRGKDSEPTISPFWLNCAGYTVVGLMITGVLVFLNLIFRIGVLAWSHEPLWAYMRGGGDEL